MGAPSGSAVTRLAIIAGAGRFPFFVAQEARRQGRSVVGIGVKGWADPSLASHVEAYEELAVGEIEALIGRLQAHGVREVLMAGKVTKQVLLETSPSFDAQTRRILGTLKQFSVNAMLGRVGKRLAKAGITLLDSSTFLESFLCPAGVVTARSPNAQEEEDVAYGWRVARSLAPHDIGQTLVVKRRVVVAVEALEGTDAAIRRAHEVAGSDLVVVKLASPSQDMRFDLPILGVDSIEVCRQAGVSCIAVHARKTLLLDRDRLIKLADAAKLCVLGVG